MLDNIIMSTLQYKEDCDMVQEMKKNQGFLSFVACFT